MDKFQKMARLEQDVNYPNLDDWNESFWKHDYLVHVTAQGTLFAVNADHEQDAIDYVIDYCQEHFPGLVMTREEQEKEEFLEDYLQGGNEGLYLNTMHICIEQI